MEHDGKKSLNRALALVHQAVEPDRLNTVQEAVFAQCWEGDSYQEIADALGYDAIYIRSIGAQIWKRLTKAFWEKVTKSNFQVIIQHRLAEQSPSNRIKPVGSQRQDPTSCPGHIGPTETNQEDYYVQRPPIEKRCYEALGQQGALLRIKAPKQMGKTLLMTKVLLRAREQHYHTVTVNLRLTDGHILATLDRFFQWFCAVICDQLDISVDLAQQWKPNFGSSYNCTQFFNHSVLPKLDHPVVLALDEVDVLFEYPEIATAFLGLIRAWCEKAKQSDGHSDAWHLLKLLVIHSTEVYIPLNHHQSPFNVGLSIELPDFTAPQVLALAHRYRIMWGDQEVASIMALVGGKPNLIRLTLDWIMGTSAALDDVIENATTSTGIFHEHLRQQFRLIQKYPALIPLLQQVMLSD